MLEMHLGRFAGVMLGVKMVAMGHVSMMRSLFVSSCFMVRGRVAMMLGGMFVMLGGFVMMFSGCF